jgi:Domain of unknown function (DUF4838)/Glycosyl hydrolases family 2, sugar binding domain
MKVPRHCTPTFASIALLIISSIASAATLIENGKANTVIVIPKNPSPIVQYASKEFRIHFQKATGVALPIVSESQVQGTSKTLVLIGPTRLAREMGIDEQKFAPEGYVIKVAKNRIILAGRDRGYRDGRRIVSDPLIMRYVQPGTLWAVYAFLEKHLGVRWLWPGELGTVVPKRTTIQLEDSDLRNAPQLIQRYIRSSILNRQMPPVYRKMGVNKAEQRRMQDEYRVWNRRQMMGTTWPAGAGHAYTGWYKKYYKTKRDWFAMRPDGKRYVLDLPKKEAYTKFCISNPEVVDAMFKQGLDYLRRKPDMLSFSACPNDSSGYCLCPGCLAMDDTKAKPVTYWYKLADGREVSKPWFAMTDRYAKLWNELGTRLAKVHPDKYVFGYAYSDYRTPPKSTKIAKNVIVAYVGFDPLRREFNQASRKDWNGWAATGCRLYLRPNYLGKGHGFPLVYARRMGQDIKACLKTGMMGSDFDSWQNHFATQGINVYVLMKLLADPSRDVDGIIDEYCEAGFGDAAPAIKSYLELCEKVSDRVYKEGWPNSRAASYAHYGKLFDRRFVAEADALFKRAHVLEDDPVVRKRIAFLRAGMRYAELAGQSMLKTYELSTEGLDPAGTLATIGSKEKLLETLKTSWAVSVPTLRVREWDRKFMPYFGLDAYRDLQGKQVFALLSKWKFALDPKNKGEKEGYHTRGYDDSTWASIKAGKWWEEQGYGGGPDKDQLKGGYNGYAWYRATVSVPKKLRGKKIILRLGGIDENGWVYVNGKQVAVTTMKENPNAYKMPVVCNITDIIKHDQPVSIAVKVLDENGAGGLWKLVCLYSE